MSYWNALAVLLNIPFKTYISVVVLAVEGFVQNGLRNELIVVPFIKTLKQVICEGLTEKINSSLGNPIKDCISLAVLRVAGFVQNVTHERN